MPPTPPRLYDWPLVLVAMNHERRILWAVWNHAPSFVMVSVFTSISSMTGWLRHGRARYTTLTLSAPGVESRTSRLWSAF